MSGDLRIPKGFNLDTLLSYGDLDGPLNNIAAFDELHETGTPDQLRWLCFWVESQTTCASIIEYHGKDGLNRVLKGIATGCSQQRVHMGPRIASIAGFYEMAIY